MRVARTLQLRLTYCKDTDTMVRSESVRYHELPRFALAALGDELVEVRAACEFALLDEDVIEHTPDAVTLNLSAISGSNDKFACRYTFRQ